MYALFSIVLMVLIVAALVDIITRQDSQVQHLPKVVWVLLVIFLPVIGSLIWFAIGREYPARPARPARPAQSGFSVPRRGSAPAGAPAVLPAHRVRSTEDELAALDREIEFHAEQARIRRLEAELAERRRLAEGTEPSV